MNKLLALIFAIMVFSQITDLKAESSIENVQSCDITYYDTIITCFPYFWDVTDTTYFLSGIYSDTLLSSQNCDSILVLDLTVYTSYISTTTAFICQGEEFVWNNRLLFQTGVYNDTLPTAQGCDSILQLNLFVDPVDTSVIRIGNGLRANLSPALSYQWFDCDGNVPIPGASNRTYFPTRTGIYKVRVNDFLCMDFSGCYTFVFAGVSNDISKQIYVYPNPVENLLYLDYPEAVEINSITLFDLNGRVIRNINSSQIAKQVNVNDLNPGFYYILMKGDTFERSIKFVKE